MEGWALFWKFVVFGGLGLFACLSVWVTIAGIGDIKRMFASLKAGETDSTDPRA